MMTPILSNLSDRYVIVPICHNTKTIIPFCSSIGRRPAILVTLLIALISTLSPLITKNLYTFIITRFLVGGILNTSFQLPFVMSKFTNWSPMFPQFPFHYKLWTLFGFCATRSHPNILKSFLRIILLEKNDFLNQLVKQWKTGFVC